MSNHTRELYSGTTPINQRYQIAFVHHEETTKMEEWRTTEITERLIRGIVREEIAEFQEDVLRKLNKISKVLSILYKQVKTFSDKSPILMIFPSLFVFFILFSGFHFYLGNVSAGAAELGLALTAFIATIGFYKRVRNVIRIENK